MNERDISKIEDGVSAVFTALREANDRIDELESTIEKRDATIKGLEEELAEAIRDAQS